MGLFTLVDAILDGALVLDPDDRILHANPPAQRLLGRADLTGVAAAEVLRDTRLQPGRGPADVVRPEGTAIAVRVEIVTLDERRVVVIHDASPERLLGSAEPLERPDRIWEERVHREDYPDWDEAYRRAAAEPGSPVEVEMRLHGLDGVTRHVRERVVAERRGDGRTPIHGVAIDVTRERAVRLQFQRLFELSNDLILAFDRTLTVRLANPAVRALLGYEPDQVVGQPWSLLVHPDDRAADEVQIAADFATGTVATVVVRCRTRGGETRWFSFTGVYDAEADLMLYIARDVTGDVAHREEMERQSRTVVLTGLVNRKRIVESLEAELGRAVREGNPPAVVLIDLDRFKVINDTHGHAAGDAVLVEVGRRLRAAVRPYDMRSIPAVTASRSRSSSHSGRPAPLLIPAPRDRRRPRVACRVHSTGQRRLADEPTEQRRTRPSML